MCFYDPVTADRFKVYAFPSVCAYIPKFCPLNLSLLQPNLIKKLVQNDYYHKTQIKFGQCHFYDSGIMPLYKFI